MLAEPMAVDWNLVRSEFAGQSDTVFVNAATTTPKPRVVQDAIASASERLYNDPSTERPETEGDWLDARIKVARLIGAAPSDLILTRNASESNNVVVAG